MSAPDKLTKVAFTNLDKILYPELKITKAQIIEYYIKMAPKMLDFLAERPVVLTRYPNGIDKESFYEKDAPMGTPSWVQIFKRYSETADRNINYIICNNLDTLVWLANLAALELHTTLSLKDSFLTPDLVLFDIDPEPPTTMDDVVEVALLLKEKLEALNLRSYVKTSGKKGLHVVIPIIRQYTFQQTRDFVHNIGKALSKESKIVVSEFSRSREAGTIFIDYLQNSHGRTMICPYSLRATPQATVSTPLEWNEVKKGLNPEKLNISTVLKRQENPWKDLLKNKQKLEVN
ncbi:MAG TPA: non-homologous end-joining DNA ligase [Candidatus Acidoferrum sp.]|nr:non-homologous end-joining DNA ligase [Candidatus Acidoferrum sp.]